MSGVQNLQAGADNWRAKYQALVAENEQREAQFRKKSMHYAALPRLLSSWVSDSDAALSGALERLLEILRQPVLPDSLPVQMDALEQKLRVLQAERKQRADSLVAALSDMAATLKRANRDATQRKALANVQRSLHMQASPGSAEFERRVLDCISQLHAAQQAFFTSLDVGQAHSGGLLSRLFGAARAAAGTGDPVPTRGAAAQYSAPAGSTENIATALHTDTADGAISDEVAAILLGLLARLDVPADKRPVLQKLYRDLQSGLALEELVEVLDNTVEVIVAALGRDQSEFENFLNSLESKLAFFDSFVRDLNRELGELVSGSEQLDSGVGEQLGAIRSAFSDAQSDLSAAATAGSLQQLQQRVFANLDAVAGLLTGFSAGQMHYVAALETRLADLQAEVAALHGEAERARQRIVEQRDKLLRDALTGVANREAYEIRLADEYKRWKRYQRPLSMVVADIDLFKQVNDNYGHAAGDKVLKIVAKIMSQQLRESDFVARYGGEEFVFLLPETNLAAAALAVEKVRAAIARSPFNFRQQPVPISSSFGVAEFAGKDTPELVFERADKALYRAKHAGRNRFECEPE
ncbi:MAG: GGDEF domain-containing protein [Pseudomonadales bacterium]